MLAVFDGHNDALTRDDHAELASGRAGGHLDLPRMRAGGVRGAIFAVFTRSATGGRERPVSRDDGVSEFEPSPPVDHVLAAADATAAAGRLLALEREGEVRVARRAGDLDRAFAGDGPPVAVLHLEGAEAIDPDLEALELWYEAGLRSLGPVWSRANAFGYGVPFISPSSPDTGPGLTYAGRALARRCAEVGIMVDVSHLNEAGFWDLARLDLGPIVASHSAAHALCPTSRNLTDAQIDAVGASGGLIGIVFAVPFLRKDFADDPDTPLSLIADHARYVADRIGVAHVALGSDYDGATIPAPLGDVAGTPRLLEALRGAGFDDRELEQIAWDNWRRVLGAWWRD
ncbi:MAG: dipeptidase [Solirubrobacterales bacterium]|nr:dipeptidase [Solirubrobacterales bacterium]